MPSFSFLTLGGEGNSRIEIKQSDFIGHAIRINSPEEAELFVAAERKTYPDARHTCYGWILSNTVNMSKYSDDGEPSGTAGLPILSVLEKKGLTDCAVTVTRYFGGILLGKGGLVRAYTEAASDAIEAAGIIQVDKGEAFCLQTGYDLSEKLQYAVNNNGWQIEGVDYAENVKISVVVPESESEKLIKTVTDLTSGRAVIGKTGNRELKKQIN